MWVTVPNSPYEVGFLIPLGQTGEVLKMIINTS
jgi:hypothetical protein